MDDLIKLPRLYVDHELPAPSLTFGTEQAHYLRAVLRRQAGDRLRVFNGRDGEYLCTLTAVDKKNVVAQADRQIHPQPAAPDALALYFAPLKKARLDMLVEKAVELGATHLHPVLTQNTENRHLNPDRLHAQIIEAAEQCERTDIPVLAAPVTLAALLAAPPALPLYACIERAADAPHLAAALQTGPAALLVGPEGGFTAAETAQIRAAFVPVTLGPQTLRAETAACAALITAQNRRHS